jgi:multidrug resistance efflux pump
MDETARLGGPPITSPRASLERARPTAAAGSTATRAVTRVFAARVLTGCLLGLAGLATATYFLFRVSADGRVTSVSVAATATIAGSIVELAVDVGDTVEVGQPIARIVNDRIGRSRLEELGGRLAASLARVDAIDAESRVKAREIERQRVTLGLHLEYRAIELETNLHEAQAKLGSLAAKRDRLIAEYLAADALYGKQLVSRLDRARANSEHIASIRDVEAQEALIAQIDGRRKALAHGLFIGGDVPPEHLRVNDLTMRLADLREMREELTANIAELRRAVAAETKEVTKLSEAVIISPVRGSVFRRTASVDQYVAPGAELVEIVDASSTRIEASFHQRYQSDIHKGATVTVSPVGGHDRIPGTVLLIAADESVRSPTVAGQWTTEQDKPMRVLIGIDSADQQRVWVGQAVKVSVGVSPLSGWRLSLPGW